MDTVFLFGRFHALELYLPISLILVAATADLLSQRPRYAHLDRAASLLWTIAATSAVVTAVLGVLHHLTGNFDPAAARLQMILGISLAAGAVLVRVLRRTTTRARAGLRNALPAVVVVLVTGVSGWMLTHGSSYLTEYLPLPGRDSGRSSVRHAADEPTLAALRAAGFQARRIASDRPSLAVALTQTPEPLGAAQIDALLDAGAAIETLSLRRASVDDRRLAELAALSNLVRLDLRDNELTDESVPTLAAFGMLEHLNLVGNAGITDAALEPLATLKSVKRIYLWGTAVTAGAAARFSGHGPALDVGVAVAIDYGEPARVGGTWNLELLDRAKRPIRAVMTLEQRGNSASGKLGPSTVLGRVRGERVSFYIITPTAFGTTSMELEGEANAGRIQGTDWTAVRVEP